MARNNHSIGLILIAVAIILLLGKVGFFGFVGILFWPIFILVTGLLLHYLYFSRIVPSPVLVPGGMLIVYSLMFFFCNIFGWDKMSYIWPGFIFGIAVGLYDLYLFNRNSPKMIFIFAIFFAVLSAVTMGIIFLFAGGIYFIALILIAVGGILILGRQRSW